MQTRNMIDSTVYMCVCVFAQLIRTKERIDKKDEGCRFLVVYLVEIN